MKKVMKIVVIVVKNHLMIMIFYIQLIYITKIEKNSLAAKAGLIRKDVIIGIDGKEVDSAAHFNHLLYKHKKGDKIKLKYIRNGSIKEVEILISVMK